MRLNEMRFSGPRPIDGYGPGFFRIGGDVHKGAVLVHAEGAETWGGYEDMAPLLKLSGAVDVLFIGTGTEIAVLPEPLRKALEAVGIGVEIMASPTACRTYNVLLSEGRRVAAALLPVGPKG